MPRRSLKADDVDGFMLAFWDEVVDTEKLYFCSVDLSISRSQQRGRFLFVANVMWTHPDRVGWPLVSESVTWPTNKATSVHAALYALACRLNVAVQHVCRDQTGEWYSSPTD